MYSTFVRSIAAVFSFVRSVSLISVAMAISSLNQATAAPEDWPLTEKFFGPDEARSTDATQVCDIRRLRNNLGDLTYGPGIDCDDKAYLFCLQYPANDCWQLGLTDIGEHRDIGHQIVITRKEIGNGYYEYCLVEPVPVRPSEPNTELWCWYSPYPNPNEAFPRDEIRRALCEHGPDWWWDDSRPNCDPSAPIEDLPGIENPTPGHQFDPVACGEPRWDRCGSFSEICRVLNFCDSRGIECLPAAERSCLRSCDAMLDGPGELCLAGEVTLCRNSDGKIQPLYCCALRQTSWCLAPIGPQADCRMLLGQPCRRTSSVPHFVDCRNYTPGPIRGELPRLQTLECAPCPGSTVGTNYCWQARIWKSNGENNGQMFESLLN